MEQESSPATVILVHGLWMNGLELRWLGRRLERCGFRARFFRYGTWSGTLAGAAAELRRFAGQQGDGTVHLLGHSLGGIVVAKMLEQGDLAHQGRIVLLGSPQQGSGAATVLERWNAGRFILGPLAGEGLVRTRPISPAGRELLVVAGTLSFGFGRFLGVAVPNDGTVAVAETQVPGAHQVLVRASHMGMLFSTTVADAVSGFLLGNAGRKG
jgi:pimeloyl-ACP methyl ester carboxylesterase